MDYAQYGDLGWYLHSVVRQRFARQGYLSAFDFFCIVIWKANRAKSKIAKRLLSAGHADLEEAVRELTGELAQQPSPRERLRCLREAWGLRLPMASAILAVLWPDDFTVYDRRVCGMLDGFYNLAHKSRFDSLWEGYQAFRRAVEEAAPSGLSLREKDRYLWGKSHYEQLVYDIETSFGQTPQ